MELISHGAEAKVYREGPRIFKTRVAKSYRHPEIDKRLRGARMRREEKVLNELDKMGFSSPRVLSRDDATCTLVLEHITGPTMREVLDTDPERYGTLIGRILAMMHNRHIVHGDVTTSNMIANEDTVYFIDFGLSKFSEKIEDKASDLHLLDRAVASAHHKHYDAVMDAVFVSYREISREAAVISKRFEEIQLRGRNKKKG